MPETSELYNEMVRELQAGKLLQSCGAVLEWDERTKMPPGGASHRAKQLSTLSGLAHERLTAPRLGELLQELQSRDDLGDADSPQVANVREALRDYERATKLPRRLVEELTEAESAGQQNWVIARKNEDYAHFLPFLEHILKLKREQAQAYGSESGVLYDALLETYEPGGRQAEIQAAFSALRDELVPLVQSIRDASKQPDETIITRSYPIEAQRRFGVDAATKIGFRFEDGRLDESAHPFCSGTGPGDCRLTTRYDEHHFPGAFFGTLHEAGHGMYEQGLDKAQFGLPMGESVSLGIHESQSRMWENFVGRSPAFWNHFFEPAKLAFPEALSNVGRDDFVFAINDVRPSYIRVEADEVTYNLHIMLRFELEPALLSGDLPPADLPSVWDETFERFFGMRPRSVSEGCLQDIHWSAGLLGYFPTYALGNMYAAQFFESATEQLGDLAPQFANGEFTPLREWLNREIHQRGRQFPAPKLVEVVTGKPLSHEPLMRHLKTKYEALYEL
ncbi:carboxypeptidase M32 [Thalassoroseus pseudoceratinae]|uniref:carboxypeptidase M32 n=1 Tax=Thalassoroseus pseudoceratinae TaxID=2713176 RepID=UPI0014219371|nr:carboxypeptidase M32 [Thalassoroseus pseudoceratinae]